MYNMQHFLFRRRGHVEDYQEIHSMINYGLVDFYELYLGRFFGGDQCEVCDLICMEES